MQYHEDGSVTFETGDYVGDSVTGIERFGEVIKSDGEYLLVSSDGGEKNVWEVLEADVYPG